MTPTLPNPLQTPLQTPRRVSVSTWALHSLLGTVAPGRPGDANATLMTPGAAGEITLLEVPALLAERNIRTMEICHFHLPTRDPGYLAQVKEAAAAAGVEIWSLWIDDGDLSAPATGERDRDWVLGWIDAASFLGARCVRVIAGKQEPTSETMQQSRTHLTTLAFEAYVRGIHVLTENWFALLARPAEVHTLLEELSGSVGLCLDFGNWGGDDKYDTLAAIAPLAESCHAKCNFLNGVPDAADFTRCLDLTKAAGFSGPYTIVYGEPGSVWASIAVQHSLIAAYCR